MGKQQNLLYVRQDIGQGTPMVLLHGMFGDGTQWRILADLLSDYYRVIVVDLLGHGKSPRPKGAQYTAGEHSMALRATLKQLGATENTTVVGYSMGGVVALQYAADYHDVAQLFMISTPFYLRPDEMVESGYATSLAYAKFSVFLFRLVDRLLHRDKILYKLVQKDSFMKGLQFLIDAYDNNLDPEITRLNLRHLINDYPFANTLSSVTAPITFYSGNRDVFVVQHQLRALKKIQPLMQAETLNIVKNDHMLVQYLPQQMVSVLTRYHEQRLHVHKDIGQGKVYVLLHGIESSATYWDSLAVALAKKYRVITIDLLGFGGSPKPLNIAYDLDEHVAWLQRTLDWLNLTDFTLMGHSLGALVGLRYTARFPRKVSRLLLVAPVFVGAQKSRRFLVRKFKYIDYFSDTGYLVSTIARAVGQKKLAKFTPTIRSVSYGVKAQDTAGIVGKLHKNKIEIIYGSKDPLVDKNELDEFTRSLPRVRTHIVQNAGHNFSLDKSAALMEIIDTELVSSRIKKTKAKPNLILRQLLSLAAPVLLAKGAFYLLAGLLLFSSHKQEVLVCGVAVLVLIQSAQFIRGSFSLKNEGLSYLSYFSLGIFGIVFGYLLASHFNFTLRLALIVVIGFALLDGLTRLLAAFLWTTNKRLKRKLIVSGLVLSLLSLAAFVGSIFSVYAIIYSLAVCLIARGLVYFFYLGISLIAAYSRSF